MILNGEIFDLTDLGDHTKSYRNSEEVKEESDYFTGDNEIMTNATLLLRFLPLF